MSKIKTYKKTTPTVDDLLIGTAPVGVPINDTKNFKIQDVVDFINPYTTITKTVSTNEIISMSMSAYYFVELIPTPGPNKYIEIDSAIWRYNHNTTAFNFGNIPQVVFSYGTGGDLMKLPAAPAPCSELCTSEDTVYQMTIDPIWTTYHLWSMEDLPFGLVMQFSVGATQGDGTWTITLTYKINTLD